MTAPRVASKGIHHRGRSTGRPDMSVVRECLAYEVVPLKPAELAIAIDVLDGQGLSAKAIAQKLGCADRTVTRRRARRRQTEGTS